MENKVADLVTKFHELSPFQRAAFAFTVREELIAAAAMMGNFPTTK